MFISQRVLHGILWIQIEKYGYLATYHTEETCIFGGNKENVKNKEITIKEEILFIIVAPEIRSQIHQIIVGWGYC